MTITEFATLVFKSPLPSRFSDDPTLHALLQKLSVWQSECSGFPLRFFTDADDPLQLHLVTGWASVAAHEAWIQGERNQELLRVFASCVDIPKVNMVHLDLDLEVIPKDKDVERVMFIERYHDHDGAVVRELTSLDDSERPYQPIWSLFGRDLVQDGGDVYRFLGCVGNGESKVGGPGGGVAIPPVERWVLKRVEL